MNELLEPVLWVLGLFTTISGLMYVLTVIDPQTDRGTTLGSPAPTGPASFDTTQPAMAAQAAQS